MVLLPDSRCDRIEAVANTAVGAPKKNSNEQLKDQMRAASIETISECS